MARRAGVVMLALRRTRSNASPTPDSNLAHNLKTPSPNERKRGRNRLRRFARPTRLQNAAPRVIATDRAPTVFRSSVGGLTELLSMTGRLRAIAAGGHVTPAATSVFGAVEEHARAARVGAAPYARQLA